MVKIKEKWQDQKNEYKALEVCLPKKDGTQLLEKGCISPVWIHFGGGNLYRAMHAEIAQDLIDAEALDAGVVVLETFDEEAAEKGYDSYKNQILQVIMLEDGTLHKRLLASTAKAMAASTKFKENWEQIISYFKNPNLQFTTFTITEKGYGLTASNGEFLPVVKEDIKKGPTFPSHTISIVTSLLYTRFNAGQHPIAMVTTDNFSRNGEKFQESVLTIARAWEKEGHVSSDFISYLNNTDKVTFPWSMIDRITPNPSQNVLNRLKEEGFEDLDLIHTAKGTNIAPFVNTEEVHYLVMEDSFPNGRPELEKGGVLLTDRKTVDKADAMKVTTCLNPLHTALAIFGSILGFESIAKEVQDPELKQLIQKVGYVEGLPVVIDPEVINPKEFIDEVVNKRFPNPAIPDTPQRIAADTSQKLGIRFGETIKKYKEQKDKSTEELTFIPLVLAGWLRYLLAVDDEGKDFTPSPDPLLKEMQEKLEEISLGSIPDELETILKPVLSNERIFGVDLYQAGLADKVIGCFKELTVEPGAVRKTLKKYLSE